MRAGISLFNKLRSTALNTFHYLRGAREINYTPSSMGARFIVIIIIAVDDNSVEPCVYKRIIISLRNGFAAPTGFTLK